jgi:hypothetical protein
MSILRYFERLPTTAYMVQKVLVYGVSFPNKRNFYASLFFYKHKAIQAPVIEYLYLFFINIQVGVRIHIC